MYKAIYSYSNIDENILSFQSDDEFNLIEEIDEHWWSMCCENGDAGLVPATFLKINEISQEAVLNSIKKCREAIIGNKDYSLLTETDRRNLLKLKKNSDAIATAESLWKRTEIPQQPKRVAPKAPSLKKGKSSKRYSAPPPPSSSDSTPTTSPTSTNQAFEDFQTGASSKIYNIQVEKGGIIHPGTQKNAVSGRTNSTTSKATTSLCNSETIVDRIARPDNEFHVGSSMESSCTITHLKGKHMTISKENNANFKALKHKGETATDQQGKQRVQNLPLKKEYSVSDFDGYVESEHSSDNISRDSFTTNTLSCSSSVPQFSERQSSEVFISENLGKQLVDAVRLRCKVSFNKSLAAVRCVLHNISNDIPSISETIQRIEEQIQDDSLNVYRGSLADEDANRLYSALENLRQHQEDSQQRNWAVHEDFVVINDLLNEVLSIMGEIDPSICRRVLEEDEFRYMNDLVVYYQMESRAALRVTLLQVFGSFCQLGKQFVSALLCSVLPTELAQDLLQDQKDMLKFLSTCLTLTMIFSTGESVPYHHYAQFNADFINFVLDTIEDPPDADKEDQAADSLVAMLLAFNKHFKSPRHNLIMQALARRSVFRTLTEKILLLVNREDDPVALFKFIQSCPDSVLKFLVDVFGSKETSGIFFTNDLYVLLDITLRQIVNRCKRDKVRTEYLSLFHSILNTTDYTQHKYRLNEFKTCFMTISENTESSESEVDVYIVKEITTRFATLFV